NTNSEQSEVVNIPSRILEKQEENANENNEVEEMDDEEIEKINDFQKCIETSKTHAGNDLVPNSSTNILLQDDHMLQTNENNPDICVDSSACGLQNSIHIDNEETSEKVALEERSLKDGEKITLEETSEKVVLEERSPKDGEKITLEEMSEKVALKERSPKDGKKITLEETSEKVVLEKRSPKDGEKSTLKVMSEKVALEERNPKDVMSEKVALEERSPKDGEKITLEEEKTKDGEKVAMEEEIPEVNKKTLEEEKSAKDNITKMDNNGEIQIEGNEIHNSISIPNALCREDEAINVDLDDMPQLEVINTEVSPDDSDSLEMPCLELITDTVKESEKGPGKYTEINLSEASSLHPRRERRMSNDKIEKNEIIESIVSKDTTLNNVEGSLPSHNENRVNVLEPQTPDEEDKDVGLKSGESPCNKNNEVFNSDEEAEEDLHNDLAENLEILETENNKTNLEDLPISPNTLQVLSSYLGNDTTTLQVVEVSADELQKEWESLQLASSEIECVSLTVDKTQNSDASVITETIISNPEVDNSHDEMPVCHSESEDVISKENENLNIHVPEVVLCESMAATSKDSNSNLENGLPNESVSNWLYLEEEVFSDLQITNTKSIDNSCATTAVEFVSVQPSTSDEPSSAPCPSDDSITNSSQINLTHSDSTSVKELKCRLSWKRIFNLSKSNHRKQITNSIQNVTSSKVDTDSTKSEVLSRESETANGEILSTDINSEPKKLNGIVKNKEKRYGFRKQIELGLAKIEVHLTPTPPPKGAALPNKWEVVNCPKFKKNQKNFTDKISSSETVLSSDIVSPVPIVLVKKLVLKRRSSDESEVDSDVKRSNMSSPNLEMSPKSGINLVDDSSKSIESAMNIDNVSEDVSNDSNAHASCNKSSGTSESEDESSLTSATSISSSRSSSRTEVEAGALKETRSNSRENNVTENLNMANYTRSARSRSSKSRSNSKESNLSRDENRMKSPTGNRNTRSMSGNRNKNNRLRSRTNSKFIVDDINLSEDRLLPKVIIKRTIGMGNTNKYRSFLRSVSLSSADIQLQPIVRLERRSSLDELAKKISSRNGSCKDELRHGLKITLKSSMCQPRVQLVPLPFNRIRRHSESESEASKKQRCRKYFSKLKSHRRAVNRWKTRRCNKLLRTSDSVTVSSDTNDTEPNSEPSLSMKLTTLNSCTEVQNEIKQIERDKSYITTDLQTNRVTTHDFLENDEYRVVENKNLTKDNITKITFQRHKKREEFFNGNGHKLINIKIRSCKQNLEILDESESDINNVQKEDTQVPVQNESNDTLNGGEFKTKENNLDNVYHEISQVTLHEDEMMQKVESTVSESSNKRLCSDENSCNMPHSTNDNLPDKSEPSIIKRKRNFDETCQQIDELPFFHPERILSISSIKKRRTCVDEINTEVDTIITKDKSATLNEIETNITELSTNTVEETSDKNKEINNKIEGEESYNAVQPSESVESFILESQAISESSDAVCKVCGHVYDDQNDRAVHVRRHPYHCQRCHLAFQSEVNKSDFVGHLSEQHPRTRERHHCLLCERSFPTAERHKMHLAGRTHRHLELTQRRTIHTLYSIFTGRNCPVLPPLTDAELAGLNWFPVEPGTIHFYHQATPLQRAVQ
ncbi:hypothetical protein L9F63_004996, partial [Diploptera punctata]